MLNLLEIYLPPFLGVAAVAYAGLAIRVLRAEPQSSNNMVSFLMLLFAGLVAGAAFSYGASNANMYSVGRVLSFFAAGGIVTP